MRNFTSAPPPFSLFASLFLYSKHADTDSVKLRKKSRRRHHKKMVDVSPVQKLYNTCNEVFDSCSAGIIPSPDNIQKLKAVLDEFKPADVGLSPDMPHFRASVAEKTPVIRYIHIHECEKFSIGIFCLPPSGVIPLHNHPGMTVFSKLLFGTMHIKSYDWVDDVPPSASAVVSTSKCKFYSLFLCLILNFMQPDFVLEEEIEMLYEAMQPDVQQPEARLAKVKVNSNFIAPCNTSILYPNDGGNMHCFTAVTACAVLDVLGPPYSEPDGRHCQYYLDFPIAGFSGVFDNIFLADNAVDGLKLPEGEKEGLAWLSEREKPEDLTFVGELYRGPVIVEN
ncbi:hypothetical protein SADUNF_Sadunf17G0080500 [Salix dunnii]|uniref:cysteine dioxygenase n=1 Tax=Salix dunnii TaxID=1413687 RepID=A0A835MEQ0_9ROSI|nr:hypothetical protein SADUNF_Sadunf17G0080500 [Salix dunnii]